MRAKFATFKENLWQIQSDVQDTVDELEFGGEAGRISDRRSTERHHVPLHLNGLDDNFKAELEWYKGEVSRLQNAEAQIQAMAVNYASLLKEREEELQKLHDDYENLKKLNAGTSGQSPLLNPDDRRSTEVGVMLVNGQESVKGGKNILSYKQPKQGSIRMQGSQFAQSAKHANAGIEIVSESEGNQLHTELKYKKLQEREKELLNLLEEKSKALSAVKVDNEKLLTELKMLKTSRIKEQSDTASSNLQHHKIVANQKELTSLKVEKQEMAKQIADLQRLLNEKNIEVNKLKEMVGKVTISNECIERLKHSIESLEKEKTELQTEKDGLLDKLNILQQESQRGNALKGLHEMPDKGPEKAHQINLSNENGGSLRESHKLKIAELEQSLKNACKERDKALRDLSRLRQHILDKEKEDTEKMDQDSERIAALQTELDDKTKHILQIERSLAYAIAGQEEAKRVSADELQRANEMISELQQKLAGCLSALEAKNVELQNLQTVLGQYYAEIEAKERVYSELAGAKDEILKLYEHLKQMNCALELKNKEKDELSEKLAISERMLVEKQQRSEGLENEIVRLRFALEQSMTRLSRMSSDSDYLVDRRIVVKLLVTYFQRQHSKEVLDLMVRMLGFSDEEKQRIGIAQQVSGKGVVRGVLGLPGRLVGGILGSGASESSPLPPTENQSFSNLWIDFLLKESEERERRENAEAHSKGTVGQDESANISGATTNAKGDSSIKPFLQNKGPFSTSHYSTSSSVSSITDQARTVETLNKGQRASYSDSEFSTVPLNSLTPSSGVQQSRMPKS